MATTRRTFLTTATAALGAARAATRARITGISLSTIQGNFHKFVAMNSQDH